MQPAKDRIDTDGVQSSAAMARIWTWVFKIGDPDNTAHSFNAA
jgi:hypothetical protein